MTTAAYRAGTLCADSGCTRGTIHIGVVRKTTRSPEGHLVAGAGDMLAVSALLAWADNGMLGTPHLDDDDFAALVIHPDRTVHLLGGDGTQVKITAEFHAIGSGAQLAMGAMAAGATAEEAVRIACRLDGGSREPVQIERLPCAASS